MSVEYCHKHDRRYDTDLVSSCPLCEEEEIEAEEEAGREFCSHCGVEINGDGYSVGETCCFYCKAD